VPLTCCLVEPDPDQWTKYRDAGVSRIIVEAPPASRDETLRNLDRLAVGISKVT
jgi:hypothetical protein